jgi:hypothetical protein
MNNHNLETIIETLKQMEAMPEIPPRVAIPCPGVVLIFTWDFVHQRWNLENEIKNV